MGCTKQSMKILVFAHTPPPLHGQSAMVELALQVLSDEAGHGRFNVYHVNARLSDAGGQIGRASFKKVCRVLMYCGAALWHRIRHGVLILYFVPAQGDRVSLVRDWIVMAICRPFFPVVVYHWHAAGLAEWLERDATNFERKLTDLLLGRPELSLVLRRSNRGDAEAVRSRQTVVVPNGIADPCPDYQEIMLRRLSERTAARRKLTAGKQLTPADYDRAGGDPEVFRVLFVGLCCREKGLFDVLEAISLADSTLSPLGLRIEFVVAGEFVTENERAEFERHLAALDSTNRKGSIRHCGFTVGEKKRRLFLTSDCFCFPTYYSAESFGLVLLEAMAFGLPTVLTCWRNLPELFPPGYPHVVDPKSPAQLSAQLQRIAREGGSANLREHFLAHYTKEVFARNLKAALGHLQVD